MMIEITELDELLNTLATSALEPHKEYKMEFTNGEQTIIYNYIKQLQEENQQLKEQLKQKDEVIDELEKHIRSLSSKGRDCIIYADVKKDILDILKKYKGVDD